MKRRGWTLLGVLISGALLALILTQIDLATAWIRLRSAHLSWLAAATGAAFLVLLLRGLRFWILSRAAPLGLVVCAVGIQNFLLRITPFRAGELSLPWLLHKAAGESAAESLVALLVVRVLDLVIVLGCAVGAGIWWFGGALTGTLYLLAGGALVLVAILVRFRWCVALGLRFARWLAERTGMVRVAFVPKTLDALDAAIAESTRLSPRRWAGLAITTALLTVVHFAIYGFLLAAFDSTADVRQLVVGTAFTQVSSALPIPTVGSIGSYEAGWIAGFVWVGVPLKEAALMGVMTQLITLGYAALFALPAAAILLRGRRSRGGE